MIRKLKMNTDELECIMQIWLKSTIKAHPFISKSYWEDNYPVVKNQYIPVSETYVYVENESIQGFISIMEKSYIGALFVDTDLQGQGVGSKLINYVKSNFEYLELAVYKENVHSVTFYKKCGFSVLKERLNEETKAPEYLMASRNIKL
jgi:putative acetyltransferase